MAGDDKALVWLHGEIRTPPFTVEARIEAGVLLRRLQRGEVIGMPHARPMPSIAAHCYELRVRDAQHNWRIIDSVAEDAIVILEVFRKTTRATPATVIATCQARLRRYTATES